MVGRLEGDGGNDIYELGLAVNCASNNDGGKEILPSQPFEMLSTSIIISIAVAAAPALAIPPPIFGFPDSDNHTELTVQYTLNGNTTKVQEGMLFGANSMLTISPARMEDAPVMSFIADCTLQ